MPSCRTSLPVPSLTNYGSEADGGPRAERESTDCPGPHTHLTDGVIAIAMTLLVLDLQIPSGSAPPLLT
jgi:hypothetical protein